jgi:molybdopterin-guanine dinucleotide biosynthesis protein B
MIASDRRWVIMHELRGAPEPTLEQQIARVAPCDLLLIEGYKHHPMPKLEIFRAANGKPALHPDDPHVVAIASDRAFSSKLPQFGLDDHDAIAEFVLAHVGLARTMTA